MKIETGIIQELENFLQKSQNIVITTHVGPDGDAIGSSLGLWHVLKALGKNVQVLTPNNYPANLAWLEGSEQICVFTADPNKAKDLVEKADLIFCLDFNDLKRLDQAENLISSANVPIITIDHHEQPKEFSSLLISEPHRSSTCEMIYALVELMNWTHLVNVSAAKALYTGLNTDTGSFKFSCTSPESHRIAAELLKKGADPVEMNEKFHDTNSPEKLRLLGYTLSQKMKYLPNIQAVYFSLTREELTHFNYQDGDTEGIVNYGLSIEGVKLSVFLKEDEHKIKLSLRSKGSFSVQQMAKEHFNGGGHHNASGGAFYGTMSEAIAHLENVLSSYA